MASCDCNCRSWQQMVIDNIPSYLMVVLVIGGSAGAVKFRHSLREFFCKNAIVKKIGDKVGSVKESEMETV